MTFRRLLQIISIFYISIRRDQFSKKNIDKRIHSTDKLHDFKLLKY